jgi:N-acetyl-gamma-glutamyl-phosphate reductase
MIRAAIIGASGYTGGELIRLLSHHPDIEIKVITSRKNKGMSVSDVFPHLTGYLDITFEEPDYEKISKRVDTVFVALPHKSAMEAVSIFAPDIPVVDLSADFRFENIETYEAWYTKHSSPELLDISVYGLPEIYRENIREAKIIGNPGCYPTGAILGLYPLIKEKIIKESGIIIDSKSGLSGAGRNQSTSNLFTEISESTSPYNVGTHRHSPEIEEKLCAIAKSKVNITFTPHLVPMSRGILSTIYAERSGEFSTKDILEVFGDIYKDEPFVRILPEGKNPNTAWVRGSNFIDIGAVSLRSTDRLVVMTAIDNLVKGASGQAIQNMNIILGFPEDAGLSTIPLFP